MYVKGMVELQRFFRFFGRKGEMDAKEGLSSSSPGLLDRGVPVEETTKYHGSRIGNRQLSTLVDICQGILLDAHVSAEEVRGLRDWCIANNYAVQQNVIIEALLGRLNEVLADDVLDDDEVKDIADLLSRIVGDPIVTGELLTSASFPLDDPPPTIEWEDSTFVFTGTAAIGTRKTCEGLVGLAGATFGTNLTRQVDYLVIGRYTTPSWAHERFGRKIERAMELPEIHIIAEDHFIRSYPMTINAALDMLK